MAALVIGAVAGLYPPSARRGSRRPRPYERFDGCPPASRAAADRVRQGSDRPDLGQQGDPWAPSVSGVLVDEDSARDEVPPERYGLAPAFPSNELKFAPEDT